LAAVGVTTVDHLPSYPTIENPFQMSGHPAWLDSLRQPAELVLFLGVVAALIVLISHYIRSTGVLRQQLRWLASAGATMLAGFMVGELLNTFGFPGEPWANTLPMLTVPVAIGVAVLRYRLWDLDLVVRVTIVYGLVAIAVTAVYVALVAGVGAMAERGGAEAWLAILATAIAATLFQPLRHTATTAVNHVIAARRPAAPEVTVRTLGGFRVERHGVPVPRSEWRSRKARQLLKILVARRGRPLHREEAIEALWPEADGGNLSNRLAVALSTLRSVLDSEKSYEPGHYVESGDDTLHLRLEHVTVDLELFMPDAASANTIGEMKKAEEMYGGDFLIEDLYEDWARPTREEARAAYLTLLHRRAEISQGLHPAEALEARLRILEIDPWDEAAHLGLIRGLETAGRHGEARRAQKRYEEIMAEIGVSPGSQ
jgi:DNA-binding SARP family transcriptional activator